MFQFIKLASALRTIKSAISAKDYLAAITALIDLMATMGLAEEAANAKGVVDGIKNGDYREITVNALALVTEGLARIFGFAPINVTIAGPDDALLHQLEYYADKAEKVGHGVEEPVKLATVQPDATAIDPALVSGIVTLVTNLIGLWLNRKSTPAA